MTQQIQLQPGNLTNTIVLNSNSIELANNHQLVKIIDVSLKLIERSTHLHLFGLF